MGEFGWKLLPLSFKFAQHARQVHTAIPGQNFRYAAKIVCSTVVCITLRRQKILDCDGLLLLKLMWGVTARHICGASIARAVRPIPIKIISVGKGNSRGATEFASEWAEKLRRYTELTEVAIKPNPANSKDAAVQRTQESEKVLKALNPGERLVALDERGKDISSEDVATLLAQASDEGWNGVAFAIGGPYGHAPIIREKAHAVVRLSSLVFNHTVARVVLLEQLYRGWTILRGEPYHH